MSTGTSRYIDAVRARHILGLLREESAPVLAGVGNRQRTSSSSRPFPAAGRATGVAERPSLDVHSGFVLDDRQVGRHRPMPSYPRHDLSSHRPLPQDVAVPDASPDRWSDFILPLAELSKAFNAQAHTNRTSSRMPSRG